MALRCILQRNSRDLMFWYHFLVCGQGPPGPGGLQGPLGAPGPAVSKKLWL